LIIASLLFIGCAGELDFAMTADECFEDETYDAEEQMCYLTCGLDETCEEDAGFTGWLGGLMGDLTSGLSFGSPEEANVFITYDVANGKIKNPQLGEAFGEDEAMFQEDKAAHQAIWKTFTDLIPVENQQDFIRYGLFTDGVEETMAYVEPNSEDSTRWNLVIDILDAENETEMIYTLIHEYGHVLTLNTRQVPFDEASYYAEDEALVAEAEAACSQFFTGEGCSLPDSYINLFFQDFWADIYHELPEESEGADALFEFYENYPGYFVTDYAATNPGEDIAESWAHFVLKPSPADADLDIAREKVLFFYDFPELVQSRHKISARLYSQRKRSG